MRVVPTTSTSLDTLNKQVDSIQQIKGDVSAIHTTAAKETSFRPSTLGTIHKKKPLPRIPASIANKNTSNLTSERNNSTINANPIPPLQANMNTNNNGYVSVGPSWTTSSYIANQFMMGGSNNVNNEVVVDKGMNLNQETMVLSESPTAITNFPPPVQQQQQHEQLNTHDMTNGFSHHYPENSTSFNNNQTLLLTQSHTAMDYYADPYYSHQYGNNGYAVYNVQPQYFGNGYYNQQGYTVMDLTNEMNTASISNNSNNGWKTSTASGNVPKNMIMRSDSLKIESAIPVPFTKGGQLPLDTLLEKPFEPNADEQQQHALKKKISKQEIYTFEAPSSILLQKLDQSAAAAAVRLQPGNTMLYDSGTETPTSSSDDNLSTPVSSVSSQFINHVEPPKLLGNQGHRHSMPLLSTRREEDNEPLTDDLEVDVSFSAVEKYFQQPNNVSPVSSARIPSPWGTSRSATLVRQNISRISTGSIPNMMSVQTVQVPDEVALAASLNDTPAITKAEQYFNEEEQKKRNNNKYSLSIASCSLINIRSNTKLYRRMAIKTRNKETQMTYAKYLLQISKLYEKNNHTNISLSTSKSSSSLPAISITGNNITKKQKSTSTSTIVESPAETRHRLLSEAGYWIEKLAKAGLPEALYIKGRWHLLGPQAEDCVMHGYDKVQEAKAFKCFLTASKAGWVDAHYELAHLWKKRGNYTKAIQCYEKGAKEKHTLSIYKMAKILLRGQLKKQKDIAKGMNYLKQAADMDDPASAEPAFVLGCIHANEFDRIGIQRNVSTAIDDSPGKVNYSLALKYLKKSAQFGYPDAIYFMGQVAETGMLGQLCDSWQAYQNYMKAAEVNHAGAMLDLSRIFSQGIPGLLAAQKDMAFKWCKRSADLGFDQAEYVLGKYYEDGIGVAPDFPLALEYFGKAASKGYQPAAKKLNRPLADGTRRKSKNNNILDQSEKYLTVVVSEPKVKQDDDDDDDYTPNNQTNYTRNNGGQRNSNNVCTIQ